METSEALRGREASGRTASVWLTAVDNSVHQCGPYGDTSVYICSVLAMEQKSQHSSLIDNFFSWNPLLDLSG